MQPSNTSAFLSILTLSPDGNGARGLKLKEKYYDDELIQCLHTVGSPVLIYRNLSYSLTMFKSESTFRISDSICLTTPGLYSFFPQFLSSHECRCLFNLKAILNTFNHFHYYFNIEGRKPQQLWRQVINGFLCPLIHLSIITHTQGKSQYQVLSDY